MFTIINANVVDNVYVYNNKKVNNMKLVTTLTIDKLPNKKKSNTNNHKKFTKKEEIVAFLTCSGIN
jgi:hypothetical protein